jgi:hypothetical protein
MQVSRSPVLSLVLVTSASLSAACSKGSAGSVAGPSPAGLSAGPAFLSNAESAGLQLLAVSGSGAGTFNLVHTASDRDATGDAQLTISVHGLPPNTTLSVMRAGDVGRPNNEQADGVCQRADLGQFAPVLGPDSQPLTLQTGPGGAGVLHVRLSGPTPDGTTIDTVYRLVDAIPATVDLRTPCFTFAVK